ncbi:MAG: hypothetical protein IT167_13515 [Bryobacterales bacterium]|nr:hypothetical protein [Bryobacterales bacterium]
MLRRSVPGKSLAVGTSLLLSGFLFLAQGKTSGKTEGEKFQAQTRFQSICQDASNVQAVAARLTKLTRDSSTKWADYDKKWNEIKPSVEDMSMKLAEIDAMKSSLSPSEMKALGKSMVLIKDIKGNTQEIRMQLDNSRNQLNEPLIRSFSRNMMQKSETLEKLTAKASKTS